MAIFSEIAYAKINLALHVRRRRTDGYHELETLFAFAADGDRLTVEPADTLSLSIKGRFATSLSTGPDNLVLRAVSMLAERHGIKHGASFSLEKRLPVAAGIGGGSADAAAALRLAARLWALPLDSLQPAEIAASLGADVPACIASRSCFGSGIGERLKPISDAGWTGMSLLLVNPGIACPTGPVFSAWDGIDRGALDARDWMNGRNDLEASAITLHPEVAEVLDVLSESRPLLARMSGSGATCFGLYESVEGRDAACAMIAGKHPEWWAMATSLR